MVPDGIFGGKNQDTGQWNGIVNELVNRVSKNISLMPFTDKLKSQIGPGSIVVK